MRQTQQARIVQRYKAGAIAPGLPLGKTFQNSKVRIHRYSDHLEITDIIDAGKRGKKCRQMSISPSRSFEGNREEWFRLNSQNALDYAEYKSNPYNAIQDLIQDLLKDYPGEINMDERQLKAVDVEPFGEVYEIEVPLPDGKSSFSITSSPLDFRAKERWWISREDPKKGFYHDTGHWARTKKDAIAFYGWMRENSGKIKNFKSFSDLQDVWRELKINYDSH